MWPYLTEHCAVFEGVYRIWQAKVKVVGQEEVDMVCARAEDPFLGETHGIWVCPSDDRAAVTVSFLAHPSNLVDYLRQYYHIFRFYCVS